MKSIWSVAMLDLLLWVRTPMAVVSALIPPITMTLLLIVLSMAVTQQPVALVIEGDGPSAQKMASLIESDDDAYLLTVVDAETATRLLRDQEVAAVITIPADFDDQIEEGNLGNVILTLNNVDIDFADDIRRAVDRSVATFDAPQLSFEAENPDVAAKRPQWRVRKLTMQSNPYLIDIEEHDLRKTNVEWLSYQVIPALVLLVLSVGLMGTALLCAQDIERKTARYLLLTPNEAWVLVAGRIFGGFLASMIALVPAVALLAVTGVIAPPPEHWPALAALFAAVAFSASGFGAILGTVLTGGRTIALSASIIATYLFLLGGGFTTISFLPEWLRTVSAFVPTRYAIDGMRQALFYQSLDGVREDLIILCTTAVVACLIGSVRVRRSWS